MREPIMASEGHVLTNGEIYGRTIYLAEGMDAAEFYEIPEAEYYEKLAIEEDTAELSTETVEKAKAYDILMGVSE